MGRAIGETMIVSIAAGNLPAMTLNPGDQVQTMTGYIVQAVGGEAHRGSLTYNSIFAVGIVLFAMTFALNLLANYFTKKFRVHLKAGILPVKGKRFTKNTLTNK